MWASAQVVSDESFVQQLARLIGPGSASFRAIRDLGERRALGESVRLVVIESRLRVLPAVAALAR
jgi:hypothetical protein